MASALVTGFLAGVGKLFAEDGKNPRGKRQVRQSIPAEERPNDPMVYNSNRLIESEGAVQMEAQRRFVKAQDPISTNIIPPLFNTMQQEKIDNFHSKNKQGQIFGGPMFQATTVGGMDRSTNNTLTGEPIEYYHNNMVPYHGLKHNPNTGGRMNEGKLELFTGFGDLIERPKREIGRMFKLNPQDIRNTAPAPDDLREERYVAALSNNKTNLLPVPQVRQAAFDALDFRPSLENFTVEARRTLNNPKLTFEGRTVDGIAQSETQYGNLGKVKKNRPGPLQYEGITHSVPGGSHHSKNKIRDNYLLRNTNKSQLHESRFNGANASATGNRVGVYRDTTEGFADGGHSLDGRVRESFRSEIENPLDNIPMNIPVKDGIRHFSDKAKITLRQLRQVQRKGNFGNSALQNSMGHVIQQPRTNARSTHRETATLRNYRGAGGAHVDAMTDRSFVTGYPNQYGGACITDRKERLLKNRMPGRARGTHYYGAEDINMEYKSRTTDIPGYSNRYLITDTRHGAANNFENYGRLSRNPYKANPDCANRMDDTAAILSQLDTNSLVIRNDV